MIIARRCILLSCLVFGLYSSVSLADPLPSWRDTETKIRLINFIESVSDPGRAEFRPRDQRIATIDNDGTLWSEQPLYFQFFFALERIRNNADNPTVDNPELLAVAQSNDYPALLAMGEEGLLDVVNASHGGLSVDAFKSEVNSWLQEAEHPESGRRFLDMTFQPMLELLRYLRDQGFTTYIVSGGGTDFVRAFAEQAYGVPPRQVIGSTGARSLEYQAGAPVVMKNAGIEFIDDGPGKVIGIESRIGRRPILAIGNSDGDFEMLDWVVSGDGPRLGIIVHHTDSEREFAYDRASPVGRLDRALEVASQKSWLIVDMARDWASMWSPAE